MQYTYWVTRDSSWDETLSNHVKIWLARPQRVVDAKYGVYWYADANAFYAEWVIDVSGLRTIPDDNRQCVRYEGDQLWQAGMSVLPAVVTATEETPTKDH